MNESRASELTVRPVREGDRRLLFEWASDPETRAQSFTSAPIAWEEHLSWFRHRVDADDVLMLIGELEGEPVGHVRFEHGEVSVVVAPGHRGRGLASALIAAGTAAYGGPAVARVKPENVASRRAFERAGYVLVDAGPPLCYRTR
jgi:RimJ/RimL family protein N-acetyltransferase